MPPRPEDSVEAADFDLPDDDELESGESRLLGSRSGLGQGGAPSSAAGSGGISRSPYELPRSEQLKGVANRIIFSRYYILFYFVMMSLSLTTVVLSLLHHNKCLPTSWHIIEVIVNAMMVLEVGTRWTAYGKKYPLTPLNVIDLLLVCFCVITLIIVFNSGCTDGSRSEENLDLVLLVVRNAVQFARLVNILRRSGHSLLSPPKPIDLSHARTASLAMDLDLDLSDDEAVAERQLSAPSSRRTLAGSGGGGGGVGAGSYEPIFTDDDPELGQELHPSSRRSLQGVRKPLDVSANQGRQNLSQEDEDMWDRLG